MSGRKIDLLGAANLIRGIQYNGLRIDSRWVLSIAGRTTLVRLQTGPLFVAPLVNNFLARQLEQLVCPNDLEANQAKALELELGAHFHVRR